MTHFLYENSSFRNSIKPEIKNGLFFYLQNYLLNAFLSIGVTPNVVRKGRKILFLEIKQLKLKFITSNAYLEGNEYEIAEQYNLKFTKHFFPMHFNQTINYNYKGKIPNLEMFLLFSDTVKLRKEKEIFVNTLQNNQYIWQFEKEIIRHCDENVWLLTICCLTFIKECFDFQIKIQDESNLNNVLFVHPFAQELCTLPSFVLKLFKYFVLNNYDIYCVNHEYGYPFRNVSKLEHEWASYLEYLHPEKNFVSAFNNAKGQKYFKECVPDLYSPITKEAIFFHGCYFHGHYQNCLSNPHAKGETRNAFLNKTYVDINLEFDRKAFLLKLNNTEIEDVKIMWECTYQTQKRNSELFKNFYENIYKPHPLFRLCPRTAIRGAFLDVFALKWTKTENPTENFFAYDINGLYSYCAINFPYMVGRYDVLMGKDLNKIEIRDSNFYINNNLIYGTMLVTILPPQNLKFPYLLYRLKNGKTVNTLCVKCAESVTNIEYSAKSKCKHNVSERQITSSYYISEISYALKLGYTLISVHECHCYKEAAYLFQDFIKKLNCLKVQNSDFLKHFETVNEKQSYLDFLNEEMNLTAPFNLTMQNVQSNKQKKNFYKLMSNALYGKLEQKSNLTKTCYVSSQRELEKIYFSENLIEEIIPLNNNVCQIEVKTDELKIKPNLKTNCYLGGQITAYARMTIYNYLKDVVNANGSVYYIDTDCIFFSLPKHCINPLPISDAVGHFKEVYSNIESFYALGPKNYVVSFKEHKVLKRITKIRGISLSSFYLQNEVTTKTFDSFMNTFLSNIMKEKQINQIRSKRFKSSNLITTNLELVTFSNDISSKRLILKDDPKLSTIPYGYQFQ
jgi:G:T-mismatch repair DNA endonuclease (very short patch repair protein)